MKKIFTFFTLFILSMSMAMQAQLLSAINDMPEGGYLFDDDVKVSGRNNAPQWGGGTTTYTFTLNYLYTYTTIGALQLSTAKGYQIMYTKDSDVSDGKIIVIQFNLASGSTSQSYDGVSGPPVGSYSIWYDTNSTNPFVNFSSNTGKVIGQIGYSGNYPAGQSGGEYYYGSAWSTNSGNSQKKLKSGTINVADGWYGPYITGSSVKDVSNNTINITLGTPAYTLTLSSNNNAWGTVSGGGRKQGNTNATVNATPATGYHWVSWSDSKSQSHSVTMDSNKSLTATFAANTYNVVFNANGGTGTMSNQSHTYGSSKALTANAFTAPAGKRFKGWATSSARANAGTVDYTNGQSVSNLTTTNNGNFNLYAVWEDLPTYTLTLNVSGNGTVTVYNDTKGEEVTFTNNEAEIEYEDEIVITYSPADGYHVGTHTFSGQGSFNSGDDFFMDEDHTITVTFEPDVNTTTYTLTLNAGAHGTVTVYNNTKNYNVTFTNNEAEIAENDEIVITYSPAAGYHVGTHTDSEEGTFDSGDGIFIGGPHTITVTFEPDVYNITYKDKGNQNFTGNNLASLPATHTYGTATNLVNATRDGYTFGGWYTSQNCTGAAITSLGATAYTSSPTVYAKWRGNITATASGSGTVSGAGTYDTGTNVTLTATPTNSNYYLYDWEKDGVSLGVRTNPLVQSVTANAAYKAIFAAREVINLTASDDMELTNGGSYWSVSGAGTDGSSNNYTMNIRFDASSLTGTFNSGVNIANTWVQKSGSSKVYAQSISTATVTEPSTGNLHIVATIIGTDEKKYVITGDYTKPIVGSWANFSWDNPNHHIATGLQSSTGTTCEAQWSPTVNSFLYVQAYDDNNYTNNYVRIFLATNLSDTYKGYDNADIVGPVKGKTYTFYSSAKVPVSAPCYKDMWSSNMSLYRWEYNSEVAVPLMIDGTGYWDGFDYIGVLGVCNQSSWLGTTDGSNLTINDNESYWFKDDYYVITTEGKDGHPFVRLYSKTNQLLVVIGAPVQTHKVTIANPGSGKTITVTDAQDNTYATGTQHSIPEGTVLTITVSTTDNTHITGWTGTNSGDITGSGNSYSLTVGAKTYNVAATFEADTYALGEWDANGGTIKTAGTAAGNYEADTELTAPELNTRTGYTFNKWRDITNGVDFNGYMPANDVTYTAQWNIVTYNLTYNGLNGESNTNPVSYNIESNDITLVAPGTRTGYTFANWTDDDNSAAVVTGIAKGSTGDRNFTATWTPNENTPYVVKHYQQNLTLDGYTEVEGDRQNLTGTTAASTAAEAKSYTGFTAQSFSQGTIAADGTTVVSIYYNRNLFTITWKNGTTTLETDENVPYGATPSYGGENPTKDADASYTYDFNTWSPAVATVTDDATYSATFTSTPVEYTITFHSNGGSIPMNLVYTVEYEDIELPTAEEMSKDNYTFAGWYDNSSLEGDAVTVVANGSTGDKEFWAKWTLNGYVITFMDYDGETTLQSTAVAQGTQPSIADPTRADDEENNIAYSFIGWKSSADENVYTTANLPVATAVVTYTAQYEPYFLIRDDKANGDAYYGALAAQAGKTLDVKYKRTFPKGRWSTLSLPFAYSFRTNINPFDGKLYYLISANYTADGYLTLNCMPVTTGIEANKAYILILGEEDENIVNPTFKGAKMKELEHKYYTAPNVDGIGNGVIFRNTIERETLEKDKRVIYLSGNRLYYPNLAPEASSWIYPFRGYFYLNIAEGQIQYSPARVRLVNEEGETIETLPEASEETSAEVKKYIENGILVIERAGIKYDAQGHIIK